METLEWYLGKSSNPIQKGWKGQASEALPKDAFTVNETPVVGKSALVPKCLTLDLGVEKPRCKEGESECGPLGLRLFLGSSLKGRLF